MTLLSCCSVTFLPHHAHSVPHYTCRCVDPLDGTTNFAHGYPCFAVSVAGQRALLCINLVFELMHLGVNFAAHVSCLTNAKANCLNWGASVSSAERRPSCRSCGGVCWGSWFLGDQDIQCSQGQGGLFEWQLHQSQPL